jgi:catechol 2,3-dioxygenase-like lactoylglutathione lyase family enzyme
MSNTINILKPHLAINVRNVERSIDFYTKMLGIEPSKVRTGHAKFDVQHPALNFTLNQVPFDEQGALSHLGIQVASTNDVAAMKSRWQEQGLRADDELQTTCCYALQDKAWVKDPDGNEWEVFTVIEDNLPERAIKLEGEVACCTPETDGKTVATVTVDSVSCGCEATPPAKGEAACCDKQAVKFGVEVDANAVACCSGEPAA